MNLPGPTQPPTIRPSHAAQPAPPARLAAPPLPARPPSWAPNAQGSWSSSSSARQVLGGPRTQRSGAPRLAQPPLDPSRGPQTRPPGARRRRRWPIALAAIVAFPLLWMGGAAAKDWIAGLESASESNSQGAPDVGADTDLAADDFPAANAGAITTPSDGRINADLVDRFEQAQAAAAADGYELVITSGWRSADRQRELIDETVANKGAEEAHKTIAPVERSAHVEGLALDIGPESSYAWLQENGSRFGLCQVYENEPWHYEPRTAVGGQCPDLVPDSSLWWR